MPEDAEDEHLEGEHMGVVMPFKFRMTTNDVPQLHQQHHHL